MPSEFDDEILPATTDILESWYRHRQPPPPKTIMIAGGGAGNVMCTTDVNIYDPYAQQWRAAAPLQQPRCDFGMATVGDSIYAVGGLGRSSALRSVEIYDSQTNRWQAGPEMKRYRSCLGVTALDGTIFAVGGKDNGQTGCTVEMLDPRQGQWMYVGSMTDFRSDFGLAAFNDCLYAVGGNSGGEILKSVEVYERRANRWRETDQPMRRRRSHAGATVFRNQVVVVGGFHDKRGVLQCAEILTDDGWVFLPEMAVPRKGLGVVHFDGYLFAFGGYNGGRSLSCIEYLRFDATRWEMSQAELPRENSDFGIALLP